MNREVECDSKTVDLMSNAGMEMLIGLISPQVRGTNEFFTCQLSVPIAQVCLRVN